MRHRQDVAILGAGIDALAASMALSQRGIDHLWVAERSRVGGHFRGWTPGSCSIGLQDLGMVALEPDFRGAVAAPLANYCGQIGSDIRPFLPEAFAFLKARGLRKEELAVTTLYRGEEFPDYFIADCFDALDSLDDTERRLIAAELEERISWDNDIRHKSSPVSGIHGIQLAEVLTRALGPRMTKEFFSDFLSCLVPDGEVLASDHRLVWMPLYWPSSVSDFLTSGKRLPKVDFWSDQSGLVATFVSRLVDEAIDQTACQLTDSVTSEAEPRIVLDFAAPIGPRRRVSIAVAHFCIDETSPRSVFITQPIHGFFRISFRRTVSGTSAILEAGGNPKDHDATLEQGRELLESVFGIRALCPGDVMTGFVPVSRPQVDEAPYAPLDGAFGANLGLNFNESLVRGLAAAQQLVEKYDYR